MGNVKKMPISVHSPDPVYPRSFGLKMVISSQTPLLILKFPEKLVIFGNFCPALYPRSNQAFFPFSLETR